MRKSFASWLLPSWLLAAAVLLVGVTLVGFGPVAAHTPHDSIGSVAVSADFADDATVFTVSRARLMRSTDGGDTWRRLVRGLDHRAVPWAVATDPSDPAVVFVTTRGDGIYRSTDGGDSWNNVSGDIGTSNLLDVVVSDAAGASSGTVAVLGPPDDPALWLSEQGGDTWSAADGLSGVTAVAFADEGSRLIVGDNAGGLHLSSDGGATWDSAEAAGDPSEITAIAVSPNFADDRTVVAATSDAGVLISTDGGATFGQTPDETGLLSGLDVRGVALADGTLWATTFAHGVVKSQDSGTTWVDDSEGLTTDEQADTLERPDFHGVVATPTDPTVFVAGFDGLFRKQGPSESWEYLVTQTSSTIAGLDVSPRHADDQTVAVATYINGAYLSTDSGDTWADISTGLAFEFEWERREDYVARLTGITFRPTDDAVTDLVVGVRGYFIESDDLGTTWDVSLPEGIVVPGEFPPDYYIPAYSSRYPTDRTSILATDGGKVFLHPGDTADMQRIADTGEEFTALAMSPDFADDDTLIGGSNKGVVVSRDGGVSWSLDDDVKRRVNSVAVSPDFADDGRAWIGTSRGLFVTRDGAESWRIVGDTPFGSDAVIESVVVSPEFATDGTMLVSAAGLGLFRSTDHGERFEAIAPELLSDQVVFNSFYHPTTEPIVFSPTYGQDQTIFGLAEDRVYRSSDGGDSWTTIVLPVTTHDIDAPPPVPLLKSARPNITVAENDAGDTVTARGDSRILTPIGSLTVKRIAFAVALSLLAVALLSIPLLGRDRASRRPLVKPVSLRIGVGVLVLVGALLVVAR